MNKKNKEFTCYDSSINILFKSATKEQLMDRIIYLEKHIEKIILIIFLDQDLNIWMWQNDQDLLN